MTQTEIRSWLRLKPVHPEILVGMLEQRVAQGETIEEAYEAIIENL